MNSKVRVALGVALLVAAAVVWISADVEVPPSAEASAPEAPAKPAPEGPAATRTESPDRPPDQAPGPAPKPAPPAVEPAKAAAYPGGPYPRTKQSMLALSWQPAFCQSHRRKAECRNEHPGSLQAKQFSLHGLWPDGCAYAGVTSHDKQLDQRGRWRDLPAPELKVETREALQRIMPGTASMLDRHEWIKHGTCDGRDAEAYYATSIALTRQVNDSAVAKLFVDRIGQTITLAQARRAMDESFGRGAGDALVMKCKSGLVQEIRLRLGRPLGPDTQVREVLQRNTANSCKSGRVDPGG